MGDDASQLPEDSVFSVGGKLPLPGARLVAWQMRMRSILGTACGVLFTLILCSPVTFLDAADGYETHGGLKNQFTTTDGAGAPADTGTPRPFEIQGHRGARDLAPENSIPGFEKAIQLGVDTLEMDVQATGDRVLVVYHDQEIDSARCGRTDGTCLRSRLFKELLAEEVRAVACDEGARIPTLEEVLQLARAAPYPVRANVEIKRQDPARGIPPEEFAALLVEVIDRTEMRARVLVQSFDAEALQAMRRLAPEIPRAALARDRGSFAKLADAAGASVLLPRLDALRREDVDTFHARGVAVIPWVVNKPEEIRRMMDWGVDGIITDRPDIALDVRDGTRHTSASAAPPDAAALPPTLWPPPAAPGAAPAVPPAAVEPARPYDLKEVRTVAATFFTSGGNVDTFLTSLFLEEYGRRERLHEILDPHQFSLQPEDGAPFHPGGMLPDLFEEAARHGAQAIVIGAGKWYQGPGIRGFRLEARLIEVRGGRVLWTATSSSGMSVSGPSAKREVVKKVLKSYPRPGRNK